MTPRIRKKNISKKYLEQKISAGSILFTILLGFMGGAIFGQALFQQNSDNVIPFTMVYSSEKATWIAESAILFQEYWEEKRTQDPTLKAIQLDFQPYGSGDSLIALLNGETEPVVWSPASNIWVPLLNAKWNQMTEKEHIIAPNYTRLIYSPVVIATWENFYQEHPFEGFHDLHDLIVENPGLVKLAHTDPRSSNSGFMATVMMVSSILNMDPAAITIDNLADPVVIQWLSEIESAAVFYGKSTGFLAKYMRDRGPEALQVAVLYENLVQDYSQLAEEKYGQKIIAVYPTEGSLFSDHPFCILDADWVSEEQKMVADEYLKFLSQKELILKAIQTGFRPIDVNLLDESDIQEVYQLSFNMEHGVTADPGVIIELHPPTDGLVIARIPDLWLLTRNSE